MITKEDESDPPRRAWSPGELFRLDARTVFWLAAQAIFFTAWLVTMNADVQQLKRDRETMSAKLDQADGPQLTHLLADHESLTRRIERLDEQGTRALGPIMKDIGQLGTANAEQDRRITRNDARVDELIKNMQENKVWIEQLRDFLRAFAHPPATVPPPPK